MRSTPSGSSAHPDINNFVFSEIIAGKAVGRPLVEEDVVQGVFGQSLRMVGDGLGELPDEGIGLGRLWLPQPPWTITS